MRLLYFFLFLVCIQSSIAQDLHYTQFDKILSRYNPATNAHIESTFRFGLNYRMQWFNLPNKFSTVQLEGAYKVQEGALKNFTTSVYFSHDMVTKTGLSNIGFNIGCAYPIKIKNHELAMGINLGLIYRKIDMSNRSFPSQWDLAAGDFDTKTSNNENYGNTQKLMFDLGAGISWKSSFKSGDFNIGLGVLHANRPKDGIARDNSRLGVLYNAHIAYKLFLKNRKYSIEPKLRYQYLDKASEMNFGLEGNIYLQPSSPEKTANAVIVGVLGRAGFKRTYDAISPLVGYKYQQFSAILSYDVHIGKFRTDFGTSSSVELTLLYTITSKKVYYYGVPCGIY